MNVSSSSSRSCTHVQRWRWGNFNINWRFLQFLGRQLSWKWLALSKGLSGGGLEECSVLPPPLFCPHEQQTLWPRSSSSSGENGLNRKIGQTLKSNENIPCPPHYLVCSSITYMLFFLSVVLLSSEGFINCSLMSLLGLRNNFEMPT